MLFTPVFLTNLKKQAPCLFTSDGFDADNNLDYFKGLGDMTVQQAVVRWTVHAYPEIFTPKRKAIITDLKKYYMRPDFFLGVLNGIGVFEAYSSLLNYVEETETLDTVMYGSFLAVVGWYEKHNDYTVAFQAIGGLLEFSGKVPLIYETLVDPVSILKGIGDCNRSRFRLETIFEKITEPQYLVRASIYSRSRGAPPVLLGVGETPVKAISELAASRAAIGALSSQGIQYRVPDTYKAPWGHLPLRGPPNPVPVKFVEFIKGLTGGYHPANMTPFMDAITPPDVDPLYNYEALETLGDNTLNKAVFWYLSDRFPQLNCSEGKEVLLRLKTSVVQTKSYADICRQLGLCQFINTRLEVPDNVAEDVLEAFFGALELSLDAVDGHVGRGFECIRTCVASVLDKRKMSLFYEDLVDPVTTLKELFDVESNRDTYGDVVYKESPGKSLGQAHRVVSLVKNGKVTLSCRSNDYTSGGKNKEAMFEAAKAMLDRLKQHGVRHSKAKKYEQFVL